MHRRMGKLFIIRSFRRKIMAASIACILLPALFTLLIYNEMAQQAIQEQAIANSQESLQMVNVYVTNQMKTMLSIANYVQQNSEMSAYFKELASNPDAYGTDDPYERFHRDQRIREQLDTLATVRGEGYGNGPDTSNFYITVLLTNGSYYMTYSRADFYPPDFMREPWFPELEKQHGLQSYWVGSSPTVFQQLKVNHPFQISVAQTLSGQGTRIYGYVIVTAMEDRLSQIFYNDRNIGEVMILDSGNRVVSSRNREQIGTTFPYLEKLTDAPSSEIFKIQGTKYLVTQEPLPMAGWHFVSQQKYKDSIANIQSIFNHVFVLQIISFLAFLLLLILLLRRFTGPLIQLGRTVSAVQRGQLSVRSQVRSEDEIGRLAYSFDQMLDRVEEMIAEISSTHDRKRQAELAMLQAQIKPHFLFNVLNSIRMKVMLHGDEESAEMIQSLSRLLRMTVNHDHDQIPLHEELDLVSDYIQLMNLRQRKKSVLQLDVAPEALMLGIPRLSLQPLIENAMIHGLDRRGGKIQIEASVEQGMLQLCVCDNGIGMSAEQVERLRGKMLAGLDAASARAETPGNFSGIGLPNVHERLKMTFGGQLAMDIDSRPGGGTCIRMKIPIGKEREHVQRDGGG